MTEDSNGGGGPENPADLLMYLGPYEAWNFGVGRHYALRILRMNWHYITALAEIGGARGNRDVEEMKRYSWLPTLWLKPKELRFIPFVVKNPFDGMPDAEQLTELLRTAFEIAISGYFQPSGSVGIFTDGVKNSRFRVAFPVADKAMHEGAHLQRPHWYPDAGLHDRIGKGKKITVMAVIDDGLPFAHRNFRGADGKRSRVECCWLQSVEIDKDQNSVLFGREYTRNQIEDLIAHYGDDEDTLYREAGAAADTEELGSQINRHATHGAHVMDLATGYARERGDEPAEEIRIIAVQLPNTIAWDTSGFGKDMYMLSAVHYIFDRADMIAAKDGYNVDNMRLVINFSYGFSGGRHDGETELEAAINELVQKRRYERKCPTALVLPAGNTFLDRLHGLVVPEDFVHDAAQFHWRIQPNDRTPSYLELWFWKDFIPHGYRIELLDPRGRLRSSFNIEIKQTTNPNGDPNAMDGIKDDLQQQIGQISVDVHRDDARARQDVADQDVADQEAAYRDIGNADHTARYRVLIVMAPTEPEDARLARADPGKWTVVIRRGQEADFIKYPIHCWIQRSADPESLRSGSRQSYFDEYKNERYNLDGDLRETDSKGAFVERFGSLNGLATGAASLIVAGYRLGAGLGSSLACARPSRYSAAGVSDEENWPGRQVDCSSMADRSRVLPGTIAAGVRSGSLSFVQGTSSAAPFVARQLAETFVTAEDDRVEQAAKENYRPLLVGEPGGSDATRKTRLGTVLVRPHWQPGIDVKLLV